MNKFNAFPIGKERKEEIRETYKNATSFQTRGNREIFDSKHYTWIDSPLDGPNIIDGKSFGKSFGYLLPEGEASLRNYIETTLARRKSKAVGVEFGGIGSRLFSEFTPGFFAKSVGVSLLDHRGRTDQLARLTERDKKINHEVLECNIFDTETYNSLNKKLENKKVDLIIERMGKGLEFVPIEPYTVSRILQTWYDLLREEGVMFVQVPVVFNNLLETWVAKIKKELESVIEIEYQKGNSDAAIHGACSAFRLRKLPRAPSELPLLDPRTVRKIPR